MKRTRSHGFDWDEFPVIGGQGSMHDLNDNSPEPRLWFAKSVSQQAARALDRKPAATIHPMGFYTGRRTR